MRIEGNGSDMNHSRSSVEVRAAFARMPTAESVYAAAAALPGTPAPWAGQEGPRWRLTVTPGGLRVGTKDYARLNRSSEAATLRHLRDDWDMNPPPVAVPKRDKISTWSAKSRSNMVWTFGAVDFAPLIARVADGAAPALVTLTLPGDWLAVAPTGEDFKRMVDKFRKRFFYAWGVDIDGIWKLEFQRRGAPHLHILTVPPTGVDLRRGLPFMQWLSDAWTACVFGPAKKGVQDPEREKHFAAGTRVDYDETLRYADPKRIAVYFSKHGTFQDKEYQNVVPEAWREPGKGPGRFWGVWKLDVVKANVELADNAQYAVARHLRKVANVRSYSRVVTDVPGWTDRRTGEVHAPRARRRKVHRRVKRMPVTRGFVMVNDGPAASADIARVIGGWLENNAFLPDAAPDHQPATGRRLHANLYSQRAAVADEFGRSQFDHPPRGFGAAAAAGLDPLAPVLPRVEGDLGLFRAAGHQSFPAFLASLSAGLVPA